MNRITALAVAVLAPALALADTSTWNIDTAHTEAGFSVRHLVISTVKGSFGKTTGTVKLDPADLTKSSVEATIDVASVNTRNEDRDKHLKSPDFFDVAKFPTITFKSTKVEKAGDGLKVTGDLTMKGVTKPVVLTVAGPTGEVKDPWGNTRRGLQAKGKVNRQDFGVTWSKVVEAGPVVGDEITIDIEAELIKAK
ncbi:MAG: YceI family protein [Deltaproteobacteria bacterium]|nr:YceI family protein [Deltaproteobacteria bacterium]